MYCIKICPIPCISAQHMNERPQLSHPSLYVEQSFLTKNDLLLLLSKALQRNHKTTKEPFKKLIFVYMCRLPRLYKASRTQPNKEGFSAFAHGTQAAGASVICASVDTSTRRSDVDRELLRRCRQRTEDGRTRCAESHPKDICGA